VTTSEVEKEIELLKENNASWVLKEGNAENGDGVVIDAKAFDENNKFVENSEKKNQLYEIGLKSNIKEVDESLIGKRSGDKVEVMVTMPDDYFIQEFKGKKVKFEMEVKEVKYKKHPEINDDFAKEFGEFQNLEELKNRIHENIGKVKENNYKRDQYRKIEDYLIEKIKMEIPESLIKSQSDFLKEEQKNYLEYYGIKDTDEHLNSEESIKSRSETAEKQVKMLFILDEIAKKENIMATEEDVDKEIERIAQTYNKKPLAIKARLEANKTLDGLKREIIRSKAMNFLFENAKRG
jgi:trigger factor